MNKILKRALLLTNQLFRWSGSEVVIVEIAEELEKRGWEVSIFAPNLSVEFSNEFSTSKISVTDDIGLITLSDFDLVYCQHQVLNYFLEDLLEVVASERPPKVIYGHLSPFNRLERPGLKIENAFADSILCNSLETLCKMIELGLDSNKTSLFPNPAPSDFFSIEQTTGQRSSLLAVSNHFPKELRKALHLIEKAGIRVTRLGRQYRSSRVTVEELASHDMVVSIGKTVQYALAANRPVYIYDRFGGPGWLTKENFHDAANHNFSGRCVGTQYPAKEIARQITDPHLDFFEQLHGLSEHRKSYLISIYVDKFFDQKPDTRRSKKVFTDDEVANFRSEQLEYLSTRVRAKPNALKYYAEFTRRYLFNKFKL